MTSKGFFKRVPGYAMVLTGKGLWISTSPLIFVSEEQEAVIEVPESTLNDLASIPWFLRRVIPVNSSHRQAAALHDYLYGSKGMKGKFTRKQCDDIFLEAMLSSRRTLWAAYTNKVRHALGAKGFKKEFDTDQSLVPNIIAKAMYWGVRIGGGGHFK